MKDLASLLFKIRGERCTPRIGHTLVAEPFLKEKCFLHGVLSIVDYVPDEGATGVVLNNRTEYKLPELLDGLTAGKDIPVFCGGPAGQDKLFFLHTLGPDIIREARCYAPGLYVGGDFDDAIAYVNEGYATDGCIRFFLGYCNWVEGQLERELERGVWVPLEPADVTPESLITDAGDAMWHRAVRMLGGDFRSWDLLPRNAVCN